MIHHSSVKCHRSGAQAVNQQCHMTTPLFVKRAVREEESSGITKGGSGGQGLREWL